MSHSRPRTWFLPAGVLMLQLSLINPFSLCAGDPHVGRNADGYTAVIGYKDGFLAAGSDGRIDWISRDGEITSSERHPGEQWNSLLAFDDLIIAAGANGSILVSSGGKAFMKMDSRTQENINSLAVLNGSFIAAADNGELMIGDNKGVYKNIRLDLKGNIVSLSSWNSDCFGVTDEGEILHTTDGLSWTIFDFNKEYSGFYPTCNFTGIAATDHRIAVAGKYEDLRPALFFSGLGRVWNEGTLYYEDDQGRPALLTEVPNAVFYDRLQDQFILACRNGKLMSLPPCSHCNKLDDFSELDLEAIAENETTLIIVGENYCMKILAVNSSESSPLNQ
jgi:hypothetical protein